MIFGAKSTKRWHSQRHQQQQHHLHLLLRLPVLIHPRDGQEIGTLDTVQEFLIVATATMSNSGNLTFDSHNFANTDTTGVYTGINRDHLPGGAAAQPKPLTRHETVDDDGAAAQPQNLGARQQMLITKLGQGRGLRLIRILSWRGGGISALFETLPGHPGHPMKLVAKCQIQDNDEALRQLAEERRFTEIHRDALHIIQTIPPIQAPIADPTLPPDTVDLSPVLLLEYLERGSLHKALETVEKSWQHPGPDGRALVFGEPQMWHIFHCLLKAVIAMAYPPGENQHLYDGGWWVPPYREKTPRDKKAQKKFSEEWDYLPLAEGPFSPFRRPLPKTAGNFSWATNLFHVGLIMFTLATRCYPPLPPQPGRIWIPPLEAKDEDNDDWYPITPQQPRDPRGDALVPPGQVDPDETRYPRPIRYAADTRWRRVWSLRRLSIKLRRLIAWCLCDDPYYRPRLRRLEKEIEHAMRRKGYNCEETSAGISLWPGNKADQSLRRGNAAWRGAWLTSATMEPDGCSLDLSA
ncbi:hypothetical protein VTJ49DRAFT_5562 [Mycothermus thermophilus]|uniref:Protein kinase domain-containing protein n=1 Tax=Humicola insolens TaxID=85995 RepID=A0ABR3V3F0_HUMIN